MTRTRSPLIEIVAALALTFGLNVNTSADQTPAPHPSGSPPLNLDTSPSFDFGDDPAVDPLFAPSTLGLSNGIAGFERVAALSALASVARQAFPPSHEVFLAYWGNPGYAVVPGTAPAIGALAGGSPLSLASAFRLGGGAEANVVPGRTAGWSAPESSEVIVGGLLYELPGAQKYVSPLVLDLDGDGRLTASRGLWQPHPARLTGPYVAFDLDGDGFKDITEWIGAGEGLLTTSPNPTSGRDLLGTAGGWPDGFAHLAAVFDLDHNGRVEGAELNGLYAWSDANTNGLADPGEVASVAGMGIVWIASTHAGDFSSSYQMADIGQPRRMFDWWPNYALALQRRWAQQAEAFLLRDAAMSAIRNILFGRVVDDNQPPRTSGLTGPRHIPPAQLVAAGIDLESFRLALLADAGHVMIGYDTFSSSGGPDRARLVRLTGKYENDLIDFTCVSLPFEQVFQIACNPSGRMVLVLGDQGSKLVVVDFDTETVAPPEGLDLRTIGLRASGVAGDPMVRFSGTGNFWFSAWQLNEQEEVIDERVWAITPWGFWSGLSLDALRDELGSLRQHYITGPQSGFFVTPTPGGTNETLWAIDSSGSDTCRVAVAQADAFGGLAAIPGQVVYAKRAGDGYTLAKWKGFSLDTNETVLATSSEPFFYPFLTESGDAALQAQLNVDTATLTYFVSSDLDGSNTTPILTAYPGQGKVARGAFAHYGPNGIEILPLPDHPAPPPPSQVWSYTLLPGSQLTDACLICGRPPLLVPMQGTFQLRLIEENPLFSTYAVENLALDAGSPPGATYKLRGQGRYHVGGEVGVLQDMFLELQITSEFTNRVCYFTNRTSAVDRRWPMIHLTLDQTNGLELQTFILELNAAPFRDLWFSTVNGMTPENWQPPTNHVSPGDLVSIKGRVVKRNQDLTRRLGFFPSPDPPDLGLDAVDVRPGSEIVFSTEQDAFSESLGPLQHGDLLSMAGRIVARNQDLLSAFVILPPVPDVGLDAVQVRGDGEIFFSIEAPIVTGTGVTLGRGDVLSNRGVIVTNNAQLLARFHPADPKKDYGLDALYVWPSGEIWFSTEEGFYGQHFEPYAAGDLLSDQGYVVYRNLDLVAAFSPLEDLADFGLDTLYVVDGAIPRLDITRSDSRLVISWNAPEAVLQEAEVVTGPWQDVSPDPLPSPYEVSLPTGTKFFRLREL